MSQAISTRVDEDQQASLVMSTTKLQEAPASPKPKFQHQKREHKSNTCLFLILVLSLIVACLIYTEHQNDRFKVRINQLTKAEYGKQTSQVAAQTSQKPDQKISQILLHSDLFDDDDVKVRVTKSTKSQKNSKSTKSRRHRTPESLQKDNLIMQKYLQATNNEKIKNSNIPAMIESMLKNGEKDFIIPKQIWLFSDNYEKESFYIKKCIENTKRVANRSGFNFTVVSFENLKNFIPTERAVKVNETIKSLIKQSTNNPVSGYEGIISKVTKQLVLLQILHNNGGVVVDKNIILTEDLSWLTAIAKNQYVSTRNSAFPTKYVGFFNVNFTTAQEKQTSNSGSPRFLSKYVGLESFFLAGVAKEEFLQEILNMIYIILLSPQSARETLNTLKIGRAITSLFIVSYAFPISCRIVLKEREDLQTQDLLPIDYFGIKSINSLYFPRKLGHYFQYAFQEKIFKNVGSYTMQQLQQTVGPLRYMTLLPYESYMDQRLRRLFTAVSLNDIQLLHPESFLAKYLFPDAEKTYFRTSLEVSSSSEGDVIWNDLPKIVWIERKGLKEDRNVMQQLCYQNIVRHAHTAGFEVREVNLQTLPEWLGKDSMNILKSIKSKAKLRIYKNTKMELAKLSLLIKYGGIWISNNYFALESFDWVTKIASFPSQFVFNRYGKLPKVLMYFYPHYGQPFQWAYNIESNTKSMQHSAFDSNFIAVQQDEPLLKDWLKAYLKFLTIPYKKSLGDMSKALVASQRWTSKENPYYAILDAIKIVMGKKQKEIQKEINQPLYMGPKSASEYYGVWGISGGRGPLKFDTTFAALNNEKGQIIPKNNPLIWRFPKHYTEGIIGNVDKMAKLYHVNSNELSQLLLKEQKMSEIASLSKTNPDKLSKYLSNPSFLDQIDKKSFFYVDLYSQVMANVTIVDGKLVFM